MNTPTITVSATWFASVMQLHGWERLGCPLCGDTEHAMATDSKPGFTTRYGCVACDEWFNETESVS